MRNAREAPLLAPCFLRPATAGTTPQDHNGMGTPRSDARNTDLNRPVAKYLPTASGLIQALSRAATRKPKRTYTAASRNIFPDAMKTCKKKSMDISKHVSNSKSNADDSLRRFSEDPWSIREPRP